MSGGGDILPSSQKTPDSTIFASPMSIGRILALARTLPAFSEGPLFRAFRPSVRPISKASKGSIWPVR
jgi:hypothetical protein